MGMMVSPFLHITFSLLMFECMYTGLEATVADDCGNNDEDFHEVLVEDSSKNTSLISISTTNFKCLLYPTHEVNCSWSFQSFGTEAKITTSISICDGGKTMQTQESKASVGSYSGHIEKTVTHLILRFHIILHDQWAVYNYVYDNETVEVLAPPSNVQALFKDSDLLITWGEPVCLIHCRVKFVEYELHINDQVKHVKGKLSYTEPNVDLTQSYTVTIRSRIQDLYPGSYHWSDWSPPVTIPAKQSLYHILALSLGLPMILLALLLVACQRLSKRLFPPIPSPSPRYLNVLQNNDHFVPPNLTVNPDEEITIVFYSEKEKAHKCV